MDICGKLIYLSSTEERNQDKAGLAQWAAKKPSALAQHMEVGLSFHVLEFELKLYSQYTQLAVACISQVEAKRSREISEIKIQRHKESVATIITPKYHAKAFLLVPKSGYPPRGWEESDLERVGETLEWNYLVLSPNPLAGRSASFYLLPNSFLLMFIPLSLARHSPSTCKRSHSFAQEKSFIHDGAKHAQSERTPARRSREA